MKNSKIKEIEEQLQRFDQQVGIETIPEGEFSHEDMQRTIRKVLEMEKYLVPRRPADLPPIMYNHNWGGPFAQ